MSFRFHSLPERFDVMRRPWILRIVLVAIVAGIAGFVFRDALLGTPVATAVVARGDIVQTVVASGRVMTPQRMSVGAVSTDRVVRIPVEEGQDVKRGTVLVELDDADERAAVAQARAAVAQAEAKIRQLGEVALPGARQSLVGAQANQVLAQQQFDRAQELKAKGFVSAAALDDAKRNLDVAQSQLETARLSVGSYGPAGSDYLVAQTALAQARAAVEAAQARLDVALDRERHRLGGVDHLGQEDRDLVTLRRHGFPPPRRAGPASASGPGGAGPWPRSRRSPAPRRCPRGRDRRRP